MTLSLQEISDRMEIQDVMVAYCYAVDTRNWDALDEVFTPDAVIDYSEMVGVKGTLAEIKAFLAEGMKPVLASQHAISTTQLTLEGDHAHGRTVCNNPMVLSGAGEGHVMFLGLWYRNTFVRTPAGWRIASLYEEKCYRYNVPPSFVADDVTPVSHPVVTRVRR